MTPNLRLFLVLWLAGMAGVLSFLLVDISALIQTLPLPPGTPPPELPPPGLLELAVILQPAVLTSIAVVIGIWLAPKVGLHAPAAEAFAHGKPVLPELRSQILPGVLAGLASGTAIVAAWAIAKPFMPAEFITRAEEFNKFIPHAVRILYGGFTEEILLRWGFMTLVVWASWRIGYKIGSGRELGSSPPHRIYFIAAIFISALIFGMGHLPIASALAGGLTVPIVVFVITANSLFGIVAGFLYWRRGLEAAVFAHMCAHIVLITAIQLAL